MSKANDITGDRITNALKGDKQKYRDNWDKVFGKKHKDTSVLEDIESVSKEMDKMNIED